MLMICLLRVNWIINQNKDVGLKCFQLNIIAKIMLVFPFKKRRSYDFQNRNRDVASCRPSNMRRQFWLQWDGISFHYSLDRETAIPEGGDNISNSHSAFSTILVQ